MINVTVIVLLGDDHRVTMWQGDGFQHNRVNCVLRDFVNDRHSPKPTGAVVVIDGEVSQYTASEVVELAGDAK